MISFHTERIFNFPQQTTFTLITSLHFLLFGSTAAFRWHCHNTVPPPTIIVSRALPRGPNEEICIIISNSSHWLVLYLRGHYPQPKPKPQRYTQRGVPPHFGRVESCTFARPPPAKDIAFYSTNSRCNGNQSTDFRRWRTPNCTQVPMVPGGWCTAGWPRRVRSGES